MKRTLVTLVTGMTLLQATPALGKPGFPNDLDRDCAGAGRIPPNPAELARLRDPQLGDCALCHGFDLAQGTVPEKRNLTPDGAAWKADLDPFCVLPEVNRAPALAPIGSQRVDVGQLLMFVVSASDPDGDAVRLAAANLPDGASFGVDGDGQGAFSWTPATGQLGEFTPLFLATDDGQPMLTASQEVTIAVGASNRAPVLAPIGDRRVDVGAPLALVLSASDADGDPLVFSAEPLPAGAVLRSGPDGQGAFDWTPAAGQQGNHPIRFAVTDGQALDSEPVVISVGAVNAPPVLSPIGNRSAAIAEPLQVLITATDPDGDALRYEVSGLPTGARFEDFGDGTAELSWSPDSPGLYPLEVGVVDAGVPPEAAVEAFSILVEAPPAEGDPFLRDAWWRDRKAKLTVTGGGAAAEQAVGVVDAETGALLGARDAEDDGEFRLSVRPFLAPCAVAALVDGVMGPPISVRDAPADCAERLLVRVKKARWKCGRQELRVDGDRGPASGVLSLSDADSGDPIATVSVDDEGRFRSRTALLQPPLRIRLSAALGTREISAGPLEVRDALRGCRDESEAEERGRRGEQEDPEDDGEDEEDEDPEDDEDDEDDAEDEDEEDEDEDGD